MIGKPRPGRYRLHGLDSPEAEAVLAEHSLSRADLPDACSEPFIPLLWLKILELLGRVPEGSTARFCKDGTLPDTDIHRTTG